jgi:predicted ATPase/class 3 adenylate cyclase
VVPGEAMGRSWGMERLPSGTVTMVFSDIEGSTRLLSQMGDRYPAALDQHRAVLRSAWSSWHGYEMGTEGDSFFVVFASVGDAVSATLAAQRGMREQSWPEGEVVRVRIGVHTGRPLLHGDGYVGMDVHRAARVAGAAHGGQTLVTEAACSEAGDELLREGNLLDLGWHRLKDLSQPEHLFQISPVPLETFPPLKSLGTTTSLPVEASPLLAREQQLDDLRALQESDARLVTLTGPGGTGKTRLAIGLAALQAQAFRDGVYFVGLANAVSASAMWTSMATVLGAGSDAGDGARVLEHLATRRLLLVVDNLEQLPDAAEVVARMLEASPGLVVVATSRRALHLRSEHEYVVLPLDLPTNSDAAAAERSGAVRLFVQVATMVNPRFQLTPAQLPSVIEICRRLDGIPLAIELAAARSKLLSPRNLLARLDKTMGLSSPDADRPRRHHTLRSAIQWSYDLLPNHLKSLFDSLGVFADGCDLRAVVAVAGPTACDDALDEVAVLVDLSLASILDGPDGEPRVHLLQTISEFAVGQLASSGELDEVRLRHARYYLAVARELAPDFNAERQFTAAARVQPEYANFRAALAWCLRSDPEVPCEEAARTGLALVAVLSSFWLLREPKQARQLLERALELDSGVDSVDRVAALVGLATVMDEHLDAPRELLLEALGVATRLDDRGWTSQVMTDLATWDLRGGQPSIAKESLEQAAALADSVGDSVRLALAVHVLGEAELKLMDPERAISLFERSREIGRQRGDEAWAVWEEHWVAIAMIEAGRVGEASERLSAIVERVLEFSESLLDKHAANMHGGLRRPDGL